MTPSQLYFSYLGTARKQYSGLIETPARESTLKKFMKVEDKFAGLDVVASNLVVGALNDGRSVKCWSDQHFNHDMLWKKELRPFACREDMNGAMVEAMKDVKADDLVIFGGDLLFYSPQEFLALIKALPCQKIYVVGNHDISSNSLVNSLGDIFDALTVAFKFSHESVLDGKDVLVSHYPVTQEFLGDMYNLHGHTHTFSFNDNVHFNMSVEKTNYCLMELNELIKSQTFDLTK